MKLKRTITEVLDIPDDMEPEDALAILAPGESVAIVGNPADEDDDDAGDEDDDDAGDDDDDDDAGDDDDESA